MAVRTRRASRATLTILLGLALAAPLQVLIPATAASLPDLRVTSVKASPDPVTAGASLSVTDTTKNTGAKGAGRSSTRYYLSTDDARSKNDVLLGKRGVPVLGPDEASTKTVEVTVPAGTSAREYYVVACADGKQTVAESREANNCRATAKRISVQGGGGDGTFPLEPDPMSVGPTFDSERAVTQLALASTIDGVNTISTTGADGTEYTLEIPYKALLNSEDITMTPLAGVPDLPLSGGLVAGVRLEPEGLMLQRPAKLTIQSPNAGALGNQTAFVFHGDGDDFHLYPMAAPAAGDDKDVVRLTLTHFSTPGLGLGTDADRANVESHPPERLQAQIEQEISDLLAQERQSQLLGEEPTPGVMQQVLDLMNEYFDDILRGRMQTAETNADLGPQTIAEGLAWARQMMLLGDEDNPRIDEVMQRIEKIAKNMMNSFWTRCTVNHELAAAVWLVGLSRQAALLGWAWADEAFDKAQRCANFEVRFDSLLSGSYNQPGSTQSFSGHYRYHLTSKFEVPWTGVAEGPLHYTEAESYDKIDYPEGPDPCVPDYYTETVLTGTKDGKVMALVGVRANPREVVPGQDPPPLVFLKVWVGQGMQSSGQPKESYHTAAYNCDPSTFDEDRATWQYMFNSLHGQTNLFEFDIQTTSTEVVFTKSWNQTVPVTGGQRQEVTSLELWHKPLT